MGGRNAAASFRAPTTNDVRMTSTIALTPLHQIKPLVEKFNVQPEDWLGEWIEHEEKGRKWWTNDNEEYDVRVLTTEDKECTLPLILNYIEQAPLYKLLPPSSSDEKRSWAATIFDSMVPQGISLGAFLKESSEMCFVSLWMHVDMNDEKPDYLKRHPQAALNDELFGDVYEKLGITQYFHGGPISISPAHRNKGTLSEVMRFWDVQWAAAYPRCNVILPSTASYYVQRALLTWGYMPLSKIGLRTWVDPVTKEITYKTIPHPHTDMMSYIR